MSKHLTSAQTEWIRSIATRHRELTEKIDDLRRQRDSLPTIEQQAEAFDCSPTCIIKTRREHLTKETLEAQV